MYWKLALAQHPMYFLIKEDTRCAERTPPWGAPDIEAYIDRLKDNLATLRKYPHLKIGYEWSAWELELLAQDAPEVLREMIALVKEGQTTFYNGTYSQPHLQTLSSEANYRQFEFGARLYRGLCGHQILTYAHQESSVHEQVPQLLKAFGIQYGVLPQFTSTLVLEGGELTFFGGNGTMFVHDSEFAGWCGLDGTVIPLYLEEPAHNNIKDWLAFQEMLGLLHVPPVVIEIPDLISVDENWLAQRAGADFVLLDQVLEERLRQHPPRFQARLFTNWSYIEGIRAEELSRSNWRAEASALRAEALNALAFMLIKRPPESTDAIWKSILATQHHDVYCFCAPELRDKSIRWLQEAEQNASHLADEAARAVISQVGMKAAEGRQLVVFNTVPHPCKGLVTAPVEQPCFQVLDRQGNIVPSEVLLVAGGNRQVRFLADLPAFGYITYQLHQGDEAAAEETVSSSTTFENEFYRLVVQPDGTFTSLVVKPSGEELLETGAVSGNELAATDSTGLGPRHEGTHDILHWQKWEPSGRGPELHFKVDAPARILRSSLGMAFFTEGSLAPQVKTKLMVSFYHALPRIDLEWTFTFDKASIGTFFDDESKLRVHFPLAFDGMVDHDIPFGISRSQSGRPFFPASWVDISDGKKGLAYFHQGTPKHWVTGRMLVNLFAWGEDTDAIGNRQDLVRWPKTFDQRLDGEHTIRCALYPHVGDWRSADIIGAARSYGAVPVACLSDAHPGILPSSMELLSMEHPDIVATAVKVEEGQVICRLYSVHSEVVPVKVELQNFSPQLYSLSGERIDQLKPFQIGKLVF